MSSILRSLARHRLALYRVSAFCCPLEGNSLKFRRTIQAGLVDSEGFHLHSLGSPSRNWRSAALPNALRAPGNRGVRTELPEYSHYARRKVVHGMRLPAQHRCFSEFRSRLDDPSFWVQLDPRARLAVIAVVFASVYVLVHLERVPETGRWRFIAISEETETQLQDDQYKELLQEYSDRILPPDHPVTQQVRNVVTTILQANGLGVLASSSPINQSQKGTISQSADVEIWDPDVYEAQADVTSSDDQAAFGSTSDGKVRKWNLMVVQDEDVVNAMVVNGNIVVFTGILPIAHDIDGLAAVLSHEIAHVVARHLSEKLSSRVLIQGIFYLLEFLGFDIGLGRLVVDFLYHLPNSRVMELEADKIGLDLAARACFDPRGAVSMQTRLAQLESQHRPRINLAFLQTHPSGKTRVKQLNDALPEAYSVRAGSSACAQLEDEFDAFRAMANDVRNEQEHELSE